MPHTKPSAPSETTAPKDETTNFPGQPDLQEKITEYVRVNHAGEYGATYIYKGQLAVLGHTEIGPELKHMLEQEEEHHRRFCDEVVKRDIRPSLLSPFWRIGGYALGAASALLGKEGAMACTVAVEEAIDEHYKHQQDLLKDVEEEKPLYDLVTKCREEELEHRDTGLEHGAEQAMAYPLLYKAIRGLSEIAIRVAKKV